MAALILAEHDNQSLNPATKNVLAAALQLDQEPSLLIIGHHCADVAIEAAQLAGVHQVLCVDKPHHEHFLAETMSEVIVSLASSFDALLVSSGTFGKNIMPRVAALLDVTQVSDVSKIIDKDTFEHPIYAGNAIETVRVLDAKKVLTIRTTAFEPIIARQEACAIQHVAHELACTSMSEFLGEELNRSTRPDLANASIVVSGGRGMQSAAHFHLIEQLADALGAAVGASRAAVDAGFVPNDYQVGQTGKTVAPSLYIAVGLSGAIQHVAGMKDSKVIVAINKDEDAPIFQLATYGLVGDLFSLVPEFIEQLKKR